MAEISIMKYGVFQPGIFLTLMQVVREWCTRGGANCFSACQMSLSYCYFLLKKKSFPQPCSKAVKIVSSSMKSCFRGCFPYMQVLQPILRCLDAYKLIEKHWCELACMQIQLVRTSATAVVAWFPASKIMEITLAVVHTGHGSNICSIQCSCLHVGKTCESTKAQLEN